MSSTARSSETPALHPVPPPAHARAEEMRAVQRVESGKVSRMKHDAAAVEQNGVYDARFQRKMQRGLAHTMVGGKKSYERKRVR